MSERAVIDQHQRCQRCGHAWSFHSKRLSVQCKAMGCRGGQDGSRCPGFLTARETSLSALT